MEKMEVLSTMRFDDELLDQLRGVSPRVALVQQPCRNALAVVGPARLARGDWLIQVDRRGLVHLQGGKRNNPVLPRCQAGENMLVDGDGKDKAVVVVGMLADEVDPARRLDCRSGGAMMAFLENRSQILNTGT